MTTLAVSQPMPVWAPSSAAPATVLQRVCACGGSAGASGKCAGCESEERLGRSLLQPKLAVSAPDDPYEKEADAVAEQVMRMPAAGAGPLPVRPLVQRDPIGPEEEREEDEPVQREAAAGAGPAAPAGFAAALGAQSGGAALPAAARSFFEPRFQRDLGHVRIHDGASAAAMARAINARAFTRGSDIFFAPGQYDPQSRGGQRLLAHELTHVFQQGGKRTLGRKAADTPPAAEPMVRVPMDSPHNPNEAAAATAAADAGGSGADSPPPAAGAAAPSDGAAELPASLAAGLLRPSGGAALPSHLRAVHERRLGSPLDHVRIHQGPAAARLAGALDARAFAFGAGIWLGEGESVADPRLIAHELTHVAQQDGRAEKAVRRVPGVPASRPSAAPSAGSPAPPAGAARPVRESVTRILISCDDRELRIETPSRHYQYHMRDCSVVPGSYTAQVVEGRGRHNAHLRFLRPGAGAFALSYDVEPGQTDPVDFLRGQSTVPVEVVPHLPAAPILPLPTQRETPPTPACAISLPERPLVPAGSTTGALFPPVTLPETTIWSHPIPLGPFGLITVAARVRAELTGTFAGRYGPGSLSDICLTRMVNARSASAPINHPLLRQGSHADVSAFVLGGRARLHLPGSASVSVHAAGQLSIAGTALGAIDLAEASAQLSLDGSATLSGSVDGSVDVLARGTRSRATLNMHQLPRPLGPLLPPDFNLANTSIDRVDLAAEIGLRGRAAMAFNGAFSAGFSLAGNDIWRQSWDLARFNAGIGWAGGLRYSPNPGIHWDRGRIARILGARGMSVLQESELRDIDRDEGGDTHERAAAINPRDLARTLLDESHAPVTAPDGLSPSPRRALPFEWRKPLEIYRESIDLPNADSPQSVRRSDPPTAVSYFVGRRLRTEHLGVADWPSIGRTFQYMPYDPGDRATPQQARFNRVLDRLGFNRDGLDAEHVWDVKLRGLRYDRFDNLWPARREQQLAGEQHRSQVRGYERDLGGNVNGRYFVIARVRPPL